MWSELLAANPVFSYLVLVWLALCVGSFLNVVIHRLPLMHERDYRAEARMILSEPERETPVPESFNLSLPRSRCPHCGHQITALENIPVISWLLLRGKCSECGTPISTRYPLFEALTALLSVMVVVNLGFTWLAVAVLGATWVLIALAGIDFDTQMLPDQLTLPFVWAGLLVNLIGGYTTIESAVMGAVIGYLLLWSVYWAFKLLTGKEGMGYGDFKLLGGLGAWLGWQALPAVILLASVTGVIYAIGSGLFSKEKRSQPMPFGPFLAIAGWLCLIYRDQILAWYGLTA
ncbi:MAG: A24 family peptidase [Pseudomonadota bacterium]